MTKKVVGCSVLFIALSVMFCLVVPAQGQQVYKGLAQAGALPVGTEEPCILNPCLLYTGDFDPNGQNPNGLWNNVSEAFGITGAVYVEFNVPKKFKGAKGKTDWNIQGFFTNQQMLTPEAFSVSWAIVTGVAANTNPNSSSVKTICSGTGTPTLNPTGRVAFGLPEQTILLTGASCSAGTLEAGSYWLTFLPTVADLAYLSDVEDNTPTNAEGPGSATVDDSFFVAPDFGFSTFTPTAPTVCGGIGCDLFSFGIIGTAVH